MQQVPEKLRNLTLSRCHRGKNITSGKAYSTYTKNILQFFMTCLSYLWDRILRFDLLEVMVFPL
jgi:phage-related holin